MKSNPPWNGFLKDFIKTDGEAPEDSNIDISPSRTRFTSTKESNNPYGIARMRSFQVGELAWKMHFLLNPFNGLSQPVDLFLNKSNVW
ncbi:MAG: hypothetical protein Q9206_000853 [Seirophora lacunosa]